LTTLFEPSDLILFRPVESWSEGGRKRSRVDYRNVCYRPAKATTLEQTLARLETSSESERTNLFFGVCPRFGNKGRFDLAWQIRVVRCLWADLDGCNVAQAIERCTSQSIPTPTAIVNSGNGVHLYWLLDRPFLIDDVGNPPPVETEWSIGGDGRKKPKRYILDGKDRVFLDRRHHLTKTSSKALQVQDLLAGIASSINADHTTDLTRLLRLPGTLNRKDQRNGREPTNANLVECDGKRRYSIDAFQKFARSCEATKRQQQIEAMPLPSVRRLSAGRSDKLSELIAASSIAAEGSRSEADFAICCYAIRNGIAKDDVWARLQSVGKFAEQGRRYFDLTWDSGEFEVRTSLCDRLQKRLPQERPTIAPTLEEQHTEESEEQRTITIDSRSTPVASTMDQITERLLATGSCFNRVEQLVVVREQSISPVLSSAELTGMLNQHVEFYFVNDDGGEYKPLPSSYANTWLNNVGQRERLPAIRLFSHNPIYTEDWRLVSPGFDPQSGFYYAGPQIEPVEGTKHLDALLRDFCWKKPTDRTNYIGILLTGLLVSRFIGSKPAALFNGNQPELGKSVLAQILAILRDGHHVETASYNANDEEFEKRLGTIVRRGVTTIIIDNAKARGRNPKIDSACLERSITDPILSFRLLGFSQEIRAENSHLFCITANSPDVSRDLITRCVVINLHHEGDPTKRSFSMDDPEAYVQTHRLQLLGELVNMVERWKASGMPLAKVQTRFNKKGWGNIIGGILEANGEPDFMDNADDAASEMDETRREFEELIAALVKHSQGNWTSSELTDLANKNFVLQAELGDGTPRSQSTRMGKLAGRFVNERFKLEDGSYAVFKRFFNGQCNQYQVFIESVQSDRLGLPDVENQTSGNVRELELFS
jgi:hypothetical protein